MTLMFTKKDVDVSQHQLVRLLRLIFYRKKITISDFSTLFAEHGKRLGRSKENNDIQRNNSRKALLVERDDMTWRFFQYIMLNILKIKIIEIRLIIKTESGKLVTIGSNDPVDDDESNLI